MKRLTKREGKHTIRIGNEWRRHDVGWDRLAEYEDLEEQISLKIQENDKLVIPEKYKNMSLLEIKKEKEKLYQKILKQKENNKMTGKVKWFNSKKGYGFIANENGEDIFVHYSGINMDGYKTLADGANVTYELVETERGVAATNVVAIGE